MDATKTCPFCAEAIKPEAVKCRFCGSMLNGGAAPPTNLAAVKDEEHLKILQTCHLALAAVTAFFSCMPLIHVAVGIGMLVAPDTMFPDSHGKPPPKFVGVMFLAMGGMFVVAGWTLATLIFMAGRAIGRRKRHLFCVIVAGLSCLFMPFGTVLGVFSLVVLNRPSVKSLFDANAPA